MITLSSVAAVVVSVLILGFIAWIVESAPMIDASFKAFIKWVLLAIAAVIIIVWLLGLVGYGSGITIH